MDKISEARKRRSKTEKEGRTHICTCGKSYLSYQALYTHKRSKHSAPTPQKLSSNKKRGRPKKQFETQYDPIKLLSDHTLSQKLRDFKDSSPSVSCDDIFTEYFYEKSKILSKKDFKLLINNITNLRNCINKHYKQQENCSNSEDLQEFTALKSPVNVPTISNVYILTYLPELKLEYNLKQEVEFLLDFCKWLLSKNYTEYELSLIT